MLLSPSQGETLPKVHLRYPLFNFSKPSDRAMGE